MSHIPSDPATVRKIAAAFRDLSASTGEVAYIHVPMAEFARRSELIAALLEMADDSAAATHFDDGRPIREFWGRKADGDEWRIHVIALFESELRDILEADDE